MKLELHIHHHDDGESDAGHIQLVQLLIQILKELKMNVTVQQVKDAVQAACDQTKAQLTQVVNDAVKKETSEVVAAIEAKVASGNITDADMAEIVASVTGIPTAISTNIAASIDTIDTAATAQAAVDAAATGGTGTGTGTGAPNPPPQPDPLPAG